MRLFRHRLPLIATIAAVLAAGTAFAVTAGNSRHKTVTRSEAQSMAQDMFARLDVNKDGKLDQADRTARQSAAFDALDADRNGQVSRDEFAARHGADGQAGAGMHHGRMHHEGRGGDRRGRGRHPGMMLAGMAAANADADKDGAISQAEFGAAVLQHFDRIDADKDGSVTPDERHAAHEAMRARMDIMGGPLPVAPAPDAPKAP